MNIHEFQAKAIFHRHGVPVPRGEPVQTASEARAAAERLGGRVVVKAQIHAGGRGKGSFRSRESGKMLLRPGTDRPLGGVLVVGDAAEAETAAAMMLGNVLVTKQTGETGREVRRVLVEEAMEIAAEFYLALLLDRAQRAPIYIASAEGGTEIEKIAAERPDAIVRQNPHPTYDVFAAEQPLPADEARRKLGLDGKRVLLFFGFIRAYKGLDVLLEAVQRLETDKGYHLVVVGEFYEDAEKYRPGLDALRRRGQLTLVDRYVPNEEVPLYFSAADVVMIPYLSATQSGIIQIAYAFGKPVVATTVGGIPEVVDDRSTGYLVPAGDSDAMADAVRHYFETADRGEMAQAIERHNEKYSWERMVETVEQAWSDVAGGGA